ncbi:MAG: phosphogluconate dehydrogenase C-terminal domain-containing protein [Anaerolineae bacterium]
MITVALFGAAGKMGTRIQAKLQGSDQYRLLLVESGSAGIGRLQERGLEAATQEQAAAEAEIIVLAVPDVAIGGVAGQIVPSLNPGTLVICLDPAAPFSGELPERPDIAYFVVHPCHPPLVNDEETPEARADFFGGVARQSIVCALLQGSEADYARGEALAQAMFSPILRTHRITVEHMALLEPAMAETVTLSCMTVMREALDEAIRRGVPEQAARDFMLGHMKVNTGILFGFLNAQVSDGARMAVQRARASIFQPDWRKVFEPEYLLAEVRAITQARNRRRDG